MIPSSLTPIPTTTTRLRRTSSLSAYDTYRGGGTGWCGGGADRFIGATDTAEACWERCWNDYYGSSLVAIDWWENNNDVCEAVACTYFSAGLCGWNCK